MILLENDEENSPWMVLGDLQFWSATGFAHSLRNHAREQGLPWYVAAMLPIEFIWPGMEVRRKRRKSARRRRGNTRRRDAVAPSRRTSTCGAKWTGSGAGRTTTRRDGVARPSSASAFL